MRRTNAAAAVVFAALAAGCGGGGRGDEARQQLAVALADRLDVPANQIAVTCPAGSNFDAGDAVTCQVAVDGDEPIVLALRVEDDGTVALGEAVMPTAAVESFLGGELAGPAEGPVVVDCGAGALIVAPVGERFECLATRTDRQSFTVSVVVVDVDGTVRYEVGTTTTSTTTTIVAPPPPP